MTGNVFADTIIHSFFTAGAIIGFCELWKAFYYSIFWKHLLKRKVINEALEQVMQLDREIMDNPIAYPSAKQSASTRLAQTMHIQNIIDHL